MNFRIAASPREVAKDWRTRLVSLDRRAGETSAIRDILAESSKPGMLSLAGGLPDPSLFPIDRLREATESALVEYRSTLQYGVTSGEITAKAAGATLLGRHVPATNVIVTSGAQQALYLVSRALLRRGDLVAAAVPTYPGALQAFGAAGAQLLALSSDLNGPDVVQLERDLKRGAPIRIAYTIPHFHNPTGTTTSPDRTARLRWLANRYDFMVVDDDPYQLLNFHRTGEKVGGKVDRCVVSVRSVSKVLAPGLRVGWASGPSWLIDQMATYKQFADVQTATYQQAIVAALLDDADWFAGHCLGLSKAYSEKSDALCSALAATCEDRVDFSLPRGGFFVWLDLKQVDANVFAAEAIRSQVAVVPGSAFSGANNGRSNHVRLSFSTESADVLVDAAGRLASALDRARST